MVYRCLTLLLFVTLPHLAVAQSFLRIATGSANGTYFLLGSQIASAISHDENQKHCQNSCGVPDLVAIALSGAGSLENLELLKSGQVETAFVQADIALKAYQSSQKNLRVLAVLSPEILHVLVRADGSYKKLADLSGKRLAMGDAASGTANSVAPLLQAAGLTTYTIAPLEMVEAGEGLRNKSVDAIIFFGGYPVPAIAALQPKTPLRFLNVPLVKQTSIWQASHWPKGLYGNKMPLTTAAVPTLWLTTAALPNTMVQNVLQSFWHPRTLAFLRTKHPQAWAFKAVDSNKAPMPLHPAAAVFYGR